MLFAVGSAVKLSEGQRAAIIAAATSPVCVLTGGPGCGKTTTTKYIVDMLTTMKKKVALCAPTGGHLPDQGTGHGMSNTHDCLITIVASQLPDPPTTMHGPLLFSDK